MQWKLANHSAYRNLVFTHFLNTIIFLNCGPLYLINWYFTFLLPSGVWDWGWFCRFILLIYLKI